MLNKSVILRPSTGNPARRLNLKYSANNEAIRISQSSSTNCNILNDEIKRAKTDLCEVRLSVDYQAKDMPKPEKEKLIVQNSTNTISECKENHNLDEKLKNMLVLQDNESSDFNKPQEIKRADSRKEPTIKIKTRCVSTKSSNVNTSTNNTSVITKVEVKNIIETSNKDNMMNTLTKEPKTEEKMVKNNSTSSHRFIRSAKETAIINKFKNSAIDENLHFADRIGNPWSGFTKKPLLNKRQNSNNSNKVTLLKVDSFVERISKQPLQDNLKIIDKVCIQIPTSDVKCSIAPSESKQDCRKTIEIDTNSCNINQYEKEYMNNTQCNKDMENINLKNNLNSKGNASGRRPRPNTANFFKIKQHQNINRNCFMMMQNKNIPFQSNTAKNVTNKDVNIPTPKEYPKIIGSSFGADCSKRRKFTIKDLNE